MGKPRFPFYLMDFQSSNKKSVACLTACAQSAFGAIAKRLCSGLQSRLGRFDSGSRLQTKPRFGGAFLFSAPRATFPDSPTLQPPRVRRAMRGLNMSRLERNSRMRYETETEARVDATNDPSHARLSATVRIVPMVLRNLD